MDTTAAQSLLSAPVSFFPTIRSRKPQTVPLHQVLATIRDGTYATPVAAVRTALNGSTKARLTAVQRDHVNELKAALPAFVPAGVFDGGHKKSQLVQPSGLMLADCDDLPPEEAAAVRTAMRADHYCLAAFVTASGCGARLLFRVDPAWTEVERFERLQVYLADRYQLAIDGSCKDISRVSYVSHDPELWTKPSCDTLPIIKPRATEQPLDLEAAAAPPPPKPDPEPAADRQGGLHVSADTELDRARRYLDRIPGVPTGSRNVKLNYAAFLIARTFKLTAEDHLALMLDWNSILADPLPHEEAVRTIESAYQAALADGIGTRQRAESGPAGDGGHQDKTSGQESGPGASHQEQARTSANPLPPIENAQALIDDTTIVLPEELVCGVLHRGLKAIVGGPSKARKTFILLDMALSIQAGMKWWGWDTREARVLFLNLEIPQPFLRERVAALMRAKDIGNVSGLDLWNLRGRAAPLWRLLPEITERIRGEGYGLVAIDPLYKVLGGRDENSAGDIGQVLNEIELIAVETGAATVTAAHFAKGNSAGKESLDRISGSGVFARDPDTIMVCTPHKAEDCFTIETTLRNLPPVDRFVVGWKYPLMIEREDLDPDDLRPPKTQQRRHDLDKLLALLPPEGLSACDWQRLADKERGVSKATFYRRLEELKENGHVRQSPIDGRYTATRPENEPY